MFVASSRFGAVAGRSRFDRRFQDFKGHCHVRARLFGFRLRGSRAA
jgi:hypothetical protein